ncbi:MAG: type II secretion system F family protein [Phycisphaerae bacterium]|nr:type II secretion system F family protein [Phycisphaerae bacterium]NUQ44559.1 type II secretion system F family protein [Phycisphaerae bacterium]
MELALLVAIGAAAIGLIAYSLWPKRGDEVEHVRRRAMGLRVDAQPAVDVRKQARAAVSKSLFRRAAPLLSRPFVPKTDEQQTTLKIKLANAGFRHESASTMFLASKTAGAILLAGLGLFFASSGGKPVLNIFGQAALMGGIGFMLPEVWLWLSRRQRIEAIRNGLPDSLDLMVVSVEAGLGLDAAMMRVGDEMRLVHSELSEELQIATIETQMGIARGEALEKMAIRSGVDEMKALVAVVTQAEKLGTSVAKALRTQADSLRTKRRQRAEERAQKTAVKLMLPLILFIFPAILVVLGAPAGITLMKTMSGSGALAGK